MVQQRPPDQIGRDRLVINLLWLAAAIVMVAGFVLRSLSSLVGRSDFRLGGVALIAGGVVIAVLGWIGDRVLTRKAR